MTCRFIWFRLTFGFFCYLLCKVPGGGVTHTAALSWGLWLWWSPFFQGLCDVDSRHSVCHPEVWSSSWHLQDSGSTLVKWRHEASKLSLMSHSINQNKSPTTAVDGSSGMPVLVQGCCHRWVYRQTTLRKEKSYTECLDWWRCVWCRHPGEHLYLREM